MLPFPLTEPLTLTFLLFLPVPYLSPILVWLLVLKLSPRLTTFSQRVSDFSYLFISAKILSLITLFVTNCTIAKKPRLHINACGISRTYFLGNFSSPFPHCNWEIRRLVFSFSTSREKAAVACRWFALPQAGLLFSVSLQQSPNPCRTR
jgi:hypothetical protein